MERLFSPSTRFHDILDRQGRLEEFLRGHPGGLQELNLNVSTEEILSAERAFTYADVYAILGNHNTVAWLTPHAAVVTASGRGIICCDYRFRLNADGNEMYVLACSPSIYWRSAMLFFDCWQQASSIQ
jgi:hypothetical protein